MSYPDAAWERATTVQEVLLKAISGEIHWFRAADILGWSPRTVRRWRERYEAFGYAGLVDKRLYRPSMHCPPPGEVERILRLYQARYGGFNVRHLHEIARREHGVQLSYSFVKPALQQAGLVRKHRARGRHRTTEIGSGMDSRRGASIAVPPSRKLVLIGWRAQARRCGGRRAVVEERGCGLAPASSAGQWSVR